MAEAKVFIEKCKVVEGVFSDGCSFERDAVKFLKKASTEGNLKRVVQDLVKEAQRLMDDCCNGQGLTGSRKRMTYGSANGFFQVSSDVYRMQFTFDAHKKITQVKFMGHRSESGYGEA